MSWFGKIANSGVFNNGAAPGAIQQAPIAGSSQGNPGVPAQGAPSTNTVWPQGIMALFNKAQQGQAQQQLPAAQPPQVPGGNGQGGWMRKVFNNALQK